MLMNFLSLSWILLNVQLMDPTMMRSRGEALEAKCGECVSIKLAGHPQWHSRFRYGAWNLSASHTESLGIAIMRARGQHNTYECDASFEIRSVGLLFSGVRVPA